MQKYERYQTFYGFANLIPFLPKDQRRLRNKGNIISEDRKLKTEPHKQRSLGNDKIGEDNNYKYFGAYFLRNLRPNYHITKYLKENMDKTSMIRVLGKHGNFNRNCTMARHQLERLIFVRIILLIFSIL
jgi:hypothetical protein